MSKLYPRPPQYPEFIRQNKDSDFTLVEHFSLRGNPIEVTSFNWKMDYYTSDLGTHFIVAYQDGEFINCMPNDDYSVIVVFNSPSFLIGALNRTVYYYLPNPVFENGIEKMVIPGATNVLITDGRSDITGRIENDVVLDYVQGADGTDGKSAYEYAVEGGYTGSEQQFYIDLGLTGTHPEYTLQEVTQFGNTTTLTIAAAEAQIETEIPTLGQTRREISAQIEGTIDIVDELPPVGQSGIIYLVPTDTPNVYDKWSWVDNDYVYLGTTVMDLSNYVQEAPDDGNIYGRSSKGWLKMNNVSTIYYVDRGSTETKEDGSDFFPFKSIQSAIDAAQFGALITITPGEYTENITLAKSNITLQARDSVFGSYRVKINGSLSISGATTTSIGLDGISIAGMTTKSSTGTLYVDNCSFGGGFNITGTGYIRLDICFIANSLIQSSVSNIGLYNCQFEDSAIIRVNGTNGTGKLLTITDCDLVTIAEHINGSIISRGSTQFVGTANYPDCITSTCELNSGLLYLFGGSTFNGVSYSRINKTGTCVWCAGNLLHEPEIDILNGVRNNVGPHDVDVFSHRNPINYTTVGPQLSQHLTGIDNELGLLKNTIGDINSILDVINRKVV